MQDTPESRADLQARLASLEQADCIQLVRFRRHTARSSLGHVADVVADEVFGGDADPIEGRVGRRGEPGMIIAVRQGGHERGRIEVHPLRPGFEECTLPLVARACGRLGAALEVWIEDQPIARKDALRSARGYRDAAIVDREKLRSAGWSTSNDGRTIHHEAGDPPRVWLAALLAVFGLVCFPITLLALLFRESRDVLVGMMRNALEGWSRQWEIVGGDGRARIVFEETRTPPTTIDIDLRTTVAVTWPTGWCRDDSTGRQLILIEAGRATLLRCPGPEAVEAFLDAHC